MQLTPIKQQRGIPGATAMVRQLVEGHETAVRTALAAFATAESASDTTPVALLIERMDAHEKATKTLRSLLWPRSRLHAGPLRGSFWVK